ncbi:outer membrane efflux protein [Candidatus Methylomirabilis lanthanidiphila]|uniref:Outer membrane efflux protein n=1 Tax=Candidatus Methylomirabilis lanthanidiphila TaxID=2211376 RepID=A0A564ZP34_9BACT|nr:TolC family protein [Candidatus Methylomirabilis lanthanidiphila]VUZ86607.1 outer membrane efflux protein [Candidatus Methylomirabilis lanthanidiphila]
MVLKIGVLILVAGIAAVGAGGEAAAAEEVLRLQPLIQEALAVNPEIRAEEQRWDAARQRPSQEGSLDDPMLSFEIENLPTNSFAFTQEDMTMKKLGISQAFPFFGKLGLRSEVAQREANAVGLAYRDKRNEIVRRVKEVFYELYAIERSLEIVENNRELLRQFVKIAETKYSVGKGVQQDVLKAQVELSKLLDEEIRLEQSRQGAGARLNAILNRPPQTPLGRTEDVSMTEATMELTTLQTKALENRPLLKGLQEEIERTKAANALARKRYFPDLTMSLGYAFREDAAVTRRSDFFSAGVSINIPLYFRTKQDRQVAETSALVNSAREQYQATRNEVVSMVKELMADVEKGRKLIDLLETGMIPQARLSLDSAVAGYQVGKVDFLTLLDNRLTLFNFEKEYYRTMGEYQASLARLEWVVGAAVYSTP